MARYEDFLNPHSGRIAHLKPGKGRYQQAVDEGWQRLSKGVLPHIRRDIASGVDTKEPDYLRNLQTRIRTHPYQLTYKGETTYYRTEAERQRYADTLKRYSVTSPVEGAVTHYRTREAAERYAASLPQWYIEQDGERSYFQTERAARMSQVPRRLKGLGGLVSAFSVITTREEDPRYFESAASVSLEEAVSLGYISPQEAHQMRETAFTEAQRAWQRSPERHRQMEASFGEYYSKVLEAAEGREVHFDPETGGYYWYEEQEPEELLPLPGWSRFRGPKKGSIAYPLHQVALGGFQKVEDVLKVAVEPLDVLVKKQEALSLSLAQEGEPWAGFAAYTKGVAAYTALSVYEGFTLPLRPIRVGETVSDVMALAVDEKTRKQFVSTIVADPFKFAMGVGGGVVGGYAFGKTASKILDVATLKIEEWKLQRFYKKYPIELWLFGEEELHMMFPEEITTTYRPSVKKPVRIQDLKGRTLAQEWYYSQPPQPKGGPPKIPDTPKPLTVKWELFEGRMRVAIDQGYPKMGKPSDYLKIQKVKKGLLYKLGDELGLVKTGHEVIPAIIPEGMGVVKDIPVPLPFSLSETGHLPGLRITDVTIDLVKATSVSTLPYLASGLTSIDIAKEKARRSLVPKYEDFMKPIQFQYQEPKIKLGKVAKEKHRLKLVEMPKAAITHIHDIKEVPVQVQVPFSTQKDIQIQVQAQKTLQIQEAKLEEKPFTPFVPLFVPLPRIKIQKQPDPLRFDWHEERKRRKRYDPLTGLGELRLRPVGFRSMRDVLAFDPEPKKKRKRKG